MNSSSYLAMTAVSLVATLPLLLVCIGGAAIAVARHPRHPRVSMAVAAGCLIIVVQRIVTVALNLVLPNIVDPASLRWWYQGSNLVQTLASCVGLGLLIYAALAERPGGAEDGA